jgi:hypothetical protein
MNIDLSATTGFNDTQGLRNFLLAHRFVHLETANALSAKYNVPFSTFGLDSQLAEDAWVQAMQQGAQGQRGVKQPASLQDWLNVHAAIHNASYSLLAGQGAVAPDLSVVDFAQADQFYDWMQAHQEMHDYEYQQLGLM